MDLIQVLPKQIANQIAAGEVIQRPSSAVKELIENSIDSGADKIELFIKDSGKSLIKVVDNGSGMSINDSRNCHKRHYTSKIKKINDLFKINTMGFRGEALASIASISMMEVISKRIEDSIGIKIILKNGQVADEFEHVSKNGTTINVKNLFYNVPARRKFLKSNNVELRHITNSFIRIALANPDVEMHFYSDDKRILFLKKSNFRKRIINIIGSNKNELLVPISEKTSLVNISGFIGKPEAAKRTRGEQYFFVNGRFIKNNYLNHAIQKGFSELIGDKYFPSYFINLKIKSDLIDINIHPTKTEIKFDDEHTLYAILRSSVKHSLGQFNIAPVLDFEYDTNLDTPYDYKDKTASTPTIEVDRNYNPFADHNVSGKQTTAFKKQTLNNWDSIYVGLESKSTREEQDFSEVEFESEEKTESLFKNDSASEATYSTYQLHNKYIVSTIKSGMLLIDQHRAHQRILYENLLKSMTIKEAVSQQLLFPLELHFTPTELTILKQLKEDLEATGFIFSNFNKESIDIIGVPVNVPDSEVSIILEQLISDVEQEVPDSNFSATDLLAKSMAKSLAIKTGQSLTNSEQEHLVNSLFACKEPNVSPTNRTTFVTVDVEELDKKFM